MEVSEENNRVTDENVEDSTSTAPHGGRVNQRSYIITSVTRILIYPKEFSKVLMQLGYEPKVPEPSLTLLGRPCLLLPNIFSYVKYIKKVDGFFLGCYRGIIPHVLRHSVHMYVSDTVNDALDKIWSHEQFSNDSISSDGSDLVRQSCEEEDELDFYTNFKIIVKDWISRVSGIVASYPLRVIAVQTMAEFVGREKIMNRGLRSAVDHIYKEGGILGFYSGLVPRIIGETIRVFSIGCIGYILRTIVGNEGRAYFSISLNVLLSALVYPFNVVSTTMAVNGSGLLLGREPFSPRYYNWMDCWSHLSELNQLRRGSSLIFRYYTGPTFMANGVRRACGIHFGPDLTNLSATMI